MLRHYVSGVLSLLLLPIHTSASDLTTIDRSIKKEPAYRSKPRYCLMVLGLKGKQRAWMVQDGRTLYFDLNGNGDLTDAGERFERKEPPKGTPNDPTKLSWDIGNLTAPGTNSHFRLLVFATREDGMLGASLFPDVAIREQYGIKSDLKFLQSSWGGLTPGTEPATAPIIHLLGPPTFAREESVFDIEQPLRRGQDEELRVHVGTLGLGKRTFSSVMEFSIPKDVQPRAVIEFPGKLGAANIKVECVLDKRC